ncbi:hypothetical protein GQ43DRAFT_485226 [Delitschia confertaspora ATCC 74209]|uniref:5'-deoxynucleotidase n=1 Tax=Delitschia confertaspora ATCC 74209 TaxID=1513339 RepID=A0A9P4JGH7_9PLEO|nr:hypothetical protein GQ43DRAFT_485226 [Delitschia confertaspora ATCC 74209]
MTQAESIPTENIQTNGVANHNAEPDMAARWSVQSVLKTIPHPYPTTTNSPVSFFHLLERLKTTPRAGWCRFKIHHGESISDHMYRMSILTMMAPSSLSSRLNIPRCTKMALIHDMAESLVGDITPVDGVTKPEKNRRETEAMDYICNTLLGKWNGGLNGQELKEIWQEYEDSETLESKFVHDIDKMELILQMLEYERAHEGRVDLGEFAWVAKNIMLPEVREWSVEVLQDRVKLWKSFGKEPSWPKEVKPEAPQAP